MDKSVIIHENISMFSPSDIVYSDEMVDILKHITRVMGLRMSLLDLSYREIAPLDRLLPCDFCRIIQNDLNLYDSCVQNDRTFCRRAMEDQSVVHYHCHAGLREAVFPLFIENECIGFFLIGQFRTEEDLPHDILFKAPSHIRESLICAYKRLPEYNGDKLESIIEILKITTSYILEHHYLSLRKSLLGDRIYEYMLRNRRRSLTMKSLEVMFHRSASTINQALKLKTGKSFKPLQLSLKIDYAAELLYRAPELSIREISQRVGMEDPLYFSRIFKNYRGASPSQYRSKRFRVSEK